MSETSIEWAAPPGFRPETWNPIAGCRRISPGCGGAKGVGGCYAEKIAMRFSQSPGKSGDRFRLVVRTDENGKPTGWNGRFVEIPEKLADPLRRRVPTCYFVNSMSDLFGEGVSDEYIAAVFGVMAACPQHRFQVLTKRAERMARWFSEWIGVLGANGVGEVNVCMGETENYMPYPGRRALPNGLREAGIPWPLPNVHLGVSVEDQQRADERIPYLLQTPAAVRFLSVEPLLGPIILWDDSEGVLRGPAVILSGGMTKSTPFEHSEGYDDSYPGIDWVIVGGESGTGARTCDLAWIRSIVEQCKAARVPCFVKQLGARPIHSVPFVDGALVVLQSRKGGDWNEWPEDLRIREWPHGH